ncbi:dienelactone hydrolase family protein [Sediminicoccus sp. KRV36]|uniref:dienelactone hydrolase family protein n=1 Tax=Sediminicoccus sp. KRV36 TaxID=3133721 RepID=UPI00200CA084|nr:dienelactone hydrolase family protein [Sediminicoccus rosea]UPY35849.1 dienelactone hydrolase family protein [Sediminicoccus rosea]
MKMPISFQFRARKINSWLQFGLLNLMLLLGPQQPLVAGEAPPEPVEEAEAFTAAGAIGTLILPLGAPGRQTPAIVILQDGEEPDGRASLYMDQLLGAGFAVLEMTQWPGDSLEAVLAGLARHPRVAGQRLGLLGFGAGARLAAAMPEQVAARALLYPGCDGIALAAMPAQPVLLMHGAADPANPAASCDSLGTALGQAGASVRLRVLAGASYAWDRPAFAGEGHAMLPRPDGTGRVRAEAWPELAALSAAEVAGFFAASLLGQLP